MGQSVSGSRNDALRNRSLVHHATIEMNVESYRRREAVERKRGPGRPASCATPTHIGPDRRAATIKLPLARVSLPQSSPPPRHPIIIQIVALHDPRGKGPDQIEIHALSGMWRRTRAPSWNVLPIKGWVTVT